MSMAYCSDIEIVQGGDHKVHAAPLSHGSGLYALPHLLGGGTQVILSGFDTEEVLSALEQFEKVTMFAAPTMVTRFMTYRWLWIVLVLGCINCMGRAKVQ
jgi:acyl-CoA synthetase (AMP-forming)/AMP-acid ligase II